MTREEQFRRNLAHAFDFFAWLLDHPDQLALMPDGATVVAMPADDPELCTANAALVGGSSGWRWLS